MAERHDRALTQQEISIVLHLLRVGAGGHRPVTLLQGGRRFAGDLARLGLVDIWFRQSIANGRSEGPFYTLTADGRERATALMLKRQSRAEIEAQLFSVEYPPPPTTTESRSKTMQVRSFDPSAGQAFQGDIAIVPMPASIKISTADEIKPIDGRLIIQEGEVTGHHHKIVLPPAIRGRNFAPARQVGDPTLNTRSPKLAKAFGGGSKQAPVGTARMYRDPQAVAELQSAGILTRTDLAIGCLVVEGAPMTVTHEEHDGVTLPPGNYYCGRQVESVGAEERVVQD